MQNMLPKAEMIIRSGFFFGSLIILSLWEWLAPRRHLTVSKAKRWINNIAIIFINSLVIRLLFPAALVGFAYYVQQQHYGLFNLITINYWAAVTLSVVLLDFTIYLQHVMFHAIPIFWRIHSMHHVDLDIDVTTGIRFHPIEILISLFIKFGAVTLIGAPILAIIIFEVLLNAITMFNHSNIRMPIIIDNLIRKIIVTPDMHRVHHSDIPHETNSNFGFNLSIWDRLCGTYKDQPSLGHENMVIGIKEIRDPKYCSNLLGMLVLPFIKGKSNSPLNRQ